MDFADIALCFLLRDFPDGGREVLLGLKKTGFGAGKIVGIGGHLEPGESAAEAACREVSEESGVTVCEEDLADAGTVRFIFPARPEWNMRTRLFLATRWEGEPRESAEIVPEWFRVDALPNERMWQDAEHWLPLALNSHAPGGGVVDVDVVLQEDNATVGQVLHR